MPVGARGLRNERYELLYVCGEDGEDGDDPVRGRLRLLTDLGPGAGAYRDQIVSLIGQAGSLAATMLMPDQGNYPAP